MLKALRHLAIIFALVTFPSVASWAWIHGSATGGACTSCLLIDSSHLLAIDGSGNLLLIQ